MAIVALLIFGPKRLPELGNSVGRTIRGFRGGVKGKEDEALEDKPPAS